MTGRQTITGLALVTALAFCASPLLPLPAARVWLTLLFVVLVPGWAVVVHLRLGELSLELAVAVGLSLALGTVVATAMLAAGAWSPFVAGYLLAALALPSLAWHLLGVPRPRRARR